jgi:hypothetical protein
MAEDLRGFLLNCFIGGESGIVQPDDRWVRNRIDLSFAGRDITVMQEPWVITARASEYRDKQVTTTTVVVPNVRVEEREVVLELL